jgi:hypothetical protein
LDNSLQTGHTVHEQEPEIPAFNMLTSETPHHQGAVEAVQPYHERPDDDKHELRDVKCAAGLRAGTQREQLGQLGQA